MQKQLILSGIVLMYFLAGINKMMGFNGVVDGFSKQIKNFVKLPLQLCQLVIVGVIILEVIAPFYHIRFYV